MKIYADPAHNNKDQRYHLNDISKALWNDRSQDEREHVYGGWVRAFTPVQAIQEAEVVLLTMKWPYYVERELTHLAHEEIEKASRHHKKVVVFSAGDFPADLTDPDCMLFEPGGYRSTQGLAYHSGMPNFLWDYTRQYCGGEVRLREKKEIPSVGFCGQASSNPITTLYRKARNQYLKYLYRAGKLKWRPPPFETSSFRRQVLRQFERKEGIRTNYLLREKYHAGDQRDKTEDSLQKLEFVNNILESDYTVCMRGGGNFSIRFYETLSLGRIPIFIDTDCLLPFPDMIEYMSFFPWIEEKDLPRAAEIIRDYHSRLTNQEFKDLQVACRYLWLRHFTADGFYRDFVEKINHDIL